MNLSYQKKVCKDVLEICKPLFDSFGVNFFAQTRIFHDGHFASLMTLPELTEYYLEKKYPFQFTKGKGVIWQSGIYFADHLENQVSRPFRKELRERFNTDHFVFVVEKNHNYDDMYSIATNPSNFQIVNTVLNKMDLIKHFILYYQDKTRSILKKSNFVKYSPEYFANNNLKGSQAMPLDSKLHQKEYLEKLVLDKVIVSSNSGDIKISKREIQCLRYIAMNYTFKEIGKMLHLSPRTIETYVNNLKIKLGCEKRSELITFANDYGLNIA